MTLKDILIGFGNAMWGTPLLVLLMGGGLFFLLYSRFLPFRYFGHAINILRGKYDGDKSEGDISHYQALSTALAATVGMGNISGVAVAITMGGPGAIFWMWVSAFVGMATKFFTCTLAVMFRGKDSLGRLQGGPMYVIREGLGKKWYPLAVLFCVAGVFGTVPSFQANQLTAAIGEGLLIPMGVEMTFAVKLVIGVILAGIVAMVMFGGIKRIGTVAGSMVPFMVLIYVIAVVAILIINRELVPEYFVLIITDAFTAKSVLGGAVGAIIIAGARRAAFSNEAGIGTAPMAHGAAKTNEPIREGLVAMLGPAIDTIVVCTMTALAILLTGIWQEHTEGISGVTLTIKAFDDTLIGGRFILMIALVVFAITSLFSYSYYGGKCFSFLFGAQYERYYQYFYVLMVVWGAVTSLGAVIGLIDGMYAVMAFPTMISALILAPKVMKAAKVYFAKKDL
ncbi:sodium:alanine symporter family protein [Marivirga atlantica]|jgi:AGCS family alanine or glycine:cation symporter|uniref:Alanine:cation symporter family protein n=1 Tax=Marivirga atlantica TaxID=1548457 RepID=A0A937AAG8_9BACT|nr:alanine/glycine:cation symporter family protein [Marivirga atlantica]MBL0765281.1 alanine:cation symporter family protein [Marivirga atlantica]